MELFLVPVPIFDRYLTVEAYLFRYHLLDQSAIISDRSPLLQALSQNSVEAFTGGKPIFVPVTASKLGQIDESSGITPEVTVFLIENAALLNQTNLKRMKALRQKGYRFAALQVDRTLSNDGMLELVDYVLFGEGPMAHEDRRAMVIRYTRQHKHLKVVATGLEDVDQYSEAKKDGFDLYEGRFYREPVVHQDRELSPIKVNLIRLLDLVRDQNFEFKEIAEVMRRDPALSYSLMRFINSPYLGIRYKVKSIQHAVTILGQTEVRKWVTAAVFKALGSDHPSEVTRISLVRAKFAENLAPAFGLEEESSGLFLMGLFSLLDTMLGTTIEEALEQVHVSDEITQALTEHKGKFFPVMDFVLQYEKANWKEILSYQKEYNLTTSSIYQGNLMAVSWYNELITEQRVKLRKPPPGMGR